MKANRELNWNDDRFSSVEGASSGDPRPTISTAPSTPAMSMDEIAELLRAMLGEEEQTITPYRPGNMLVPENFRKTLEGGDLYNRTYLQALGPGYPPPMPTFSESVIQGIGTMAEGISKPYNALYTGLYRLREASDRIQRREIKGIKPDTRMWEAFRDGLRDGWNGKNVKSITDVAELYTWGDEQRDKINSWIETKPHLKQAQNITKFIGDIAIEELIENSIFIGIGAFGVSKKLGKLPKVIDFVDLMDDVPVGRGFGRFVDDANELLMKQAKLKFSGEALSGLDNNIIRNLSTDLPRGTHLLKMRDKQFFVTVGDAGDDLAAWMIPDNLKDIGRLRKQDDAMSKSIAYSLQRKAKIEKDYAALGKKIPVTKEEFKAITEDVIKHYKVRTKLNAEARKALDNIDVDWNSAELQRLQGKIVSNLYDIDTSVKQLEPLTQRKIFAVDNAKDIRNRVMLQEAYDKRLKTLDELWKDNRALNERLYEKSLETTANINKLNNGLYYDHKGISRAIREEYLAKLSKHKSFEFTIDKATGEQVRRYTNDFENAKKEFIKALTLDRTEDIADLSDEEFMGLFEYMDTYSRTPDEFKNYAKELYKKTGGMLNDTMTPSWMWYNKMGAPEIYQAVDESYQQGVIRRLRTHKRLAEIFEPWGGEKARNNKALQRRIFLLANARSESGVFRGDYATYGKLANEAGLTIDDMIREAQAAEELIEYTKNMPAELIARGQWKEGLKIEDFYIYNQLLEATEDENIEFAERVIRHYTKPDRPYNLPEFHNRVLNNDPLIEDAWNATTVWAHHMALKDLEIGIFKATGLAHATGSQRILDYTMGTMGDAGWLNLAVKGKPGYIAQAIEGKLQPWVDSLGYDVERAYKLFGKQFDREQITFNKLLKGYRTTNLISALGFNTKTLTKQTSQSLMNIPLSGYRSYIKGMESLFDAKGQSFAMKHCRLLLNRAPLESTDLLSFKGITQVSLYPMEMIDNYLNLSSGFNSNVHSLVKRSPEARRIVERYAGKKFSSINTADFFEAVDYAMDSGELRWVADVANMRTKLAQYSYQSYDMPRLLWGQLGKTMFQFTSWPANYYFSYLPQLLKSGLTGKGVAGEALTLSERTGLLKHSLNGFLLYTAGRNLGLNSDWALSAFPPVVPNVELSKESPYVGLEGRKWGPWQDEQLHWTKGGAFPTDLTPFLKLGQGITEVALGSAQGSGDKVSNGLKIITSATPWLTTAEVKGYWPWQKRKVYSPPGRPSAEVSSIGKPHTIDVPYPNVLVQVENIIKAAQRGKEKESPSELLKTLFSSPKKEKKKRYYSP